MKIQGFPAHFWVVTTPTPFSGLGDICFRCDFIQFALQIRGGLNENEIVGVYADQQAATQDAEDLLKSMQVAKGESDEDGVIHPSPWPEWFATQDSHTGVFLCDKATDEKIRVEPPKDWGRNWAWNITEDGTGIFMKRMTGWMIGHKCP